MRRTTGEEGERSILTAQEDATERRGITERRSTIVQVTIWKVAGKSARTETLGVIEKGVENSPNGGGTTTATGSTGVRAKDSGAEERDDGRLLSTAEKRQRRERGGEEGTRIVQAEIGKRLE